MVIEPLLIDEDYYARVEGREIISNLAKAAGLATMISTMRPDIDNIDESVMACRGMWLRGAVGHSVWYMILVDLALALLALA